MYAAGVGDVCGFDELKQLNDVKGEHTTAGRRDLDLSGIERAFRILCFNSWEIGESGLVLN